MPKLNHELFTAKSRLTPASKIALSVAAAAVALAIIGANWGSIASVFQSPEERFLAAYNAGDLDRALEIANEMSAADPTAAAPQQAIASIYIQKALRNERFDESLAAALSAALLAESLDAKDAENQRLIGYILELQGDLAGAELRYRQGLKLDPDSAEIIAHLAAVFERRGLTQSAEAQYERAIRLNPASAQAQVYYARFLYLTGDRDGAIAQASLASTSPNVSYAAEANRIISASYLSQGYTDKARPAAERALELAPSSPLAVSNFGELRLAELYGPNKLPYDETLSEVRALADRAISLNPNLALPYFLAFKAAYAQNDKAKAGEYATRALGLLPVDPNLSPELREKIRAVIKAIPLASATVTRQ
jgi:Tfp pilus assembly protein PilF